MPGADLAAYAAGVPFARHSCAGRNPVAVSLDGRGAVTWPLTQRAFLLLVIPAQAGRARSAKNARRAAPKGRAKRVIQ